MEYEDTPEMRMTIEKEFTNLIRSLKPRRKKEGLPQAERAIERSQHPWWRRKYQVNRSVLVRASLHLKLLSAIKLFQRRCESVTLPSSSSR